VLSLVPRFAGRVTRLRLHDGSPFTLRWRTSDLPVLQQCLLERTYDLPYGIDDCRLVIDAGANIGVSACFFAALFPSASVIAIEPDESNFALLEANTATNPRITCIRAALWGTSEPLELFDPGIGPWGMRVRPGGKGGVIAITVGQLLQRYGPAEGDVLLKLDIEGAEREVLLESGEWIERVAAIAAELHDRYVEGPTAAFTDATVGFRRCLERGEVRMVSRS
jgi:FkbM family methyltransferase